MAFWETEKNLIPGIRGVLETEKNLIPRTLNAGPVGGRVVTFVS